MTNSAIVSDIIIWARKILEFGTNVLEVFTTDLRALFPNDPLFDGILESTFLAPFLDMSLMEYILGAVAFYVAFSIVTWLLNVLP